MTRAANGARSALSAELGAKDGGVRWVMKFTDGTFLRRADYPAPCTVSTSDIKDAEMMSEESARRYVQGCSNPSMNYWYGAVAMPAPNVKVSGPAHE